MKLSKISIISLLFAFFFSQAQAGVQLINAKDGLYNDTARFEAVEKMESNLKKAFEKVCMDTFCEGEFSNLKHIALNCFINGSTSIVDTCYWDIAGSYAYADGDIIVKDARVFECEFKPDMNIMDLTEIINSASGKRMTQPMKVLHLPINAKGETLFDGLSDCL